MTKEELIDMARQAGFEGCAELTWENVICTEELVAFAKLVADKEREAFTAHAITSAEKAIDVAIKLEREACAVIAEEWFCGCGRGSCPEGDLRSHDIAATIRAKGEQE